MSVEWVDLPGGARLRVARLRLEGDRMMTDIRRYEPEDAHDDDTGGDA